MPEGSARPRWVSALRAAVFAAVTIGAAASAALIVARLRVGRRKTARKPLTLRATSCDAADIEFATEAEVSELFEQATAWISSAGGGLANETLLALYGCFKQATVGDCAEPKRPFGMESGMKWDAWTAMCGIASNAAMKSYVVLVNEACPNWQDGGGDESQVQGKAGISTGPAVSTMGCIVGEGSEDVDDTIVGQLCKYIAEGDIEVVRLMLQQSPSLVFEADKDRMTPLHWAADRGNADVVELLLQVMRRTKNALSESALSARDQNGDTPLHFAVINDHIEVSSLLVKNGANFDIENNDGETPAQLAESEELQTIFRLSA